MLNYGFGASKGTYWRKTASFDVFCVKVGAGVLAVGDWQNPPKNEKIAKTKGCAKSHMCRYNTPYLICMKFCTVVGIPDIITHANFGYDRLRGFWVAGGVKFPHSP